MPREWRSSGDIAEEPAEGREAGKRAGSGFHAHGMIMGNFEKITFDIDKFFWGALLLAVLLSGYDICRRLSVEWKHKTVGMAVEYRDLALLSRQESGKKLGGRLSPDDIFGRMRALGVEGITVSELTGKDLSAGFLPIYYGSLASLRPMLKLALPAPLDRAALFIDDTEPLRDTIVDYLRVRHEGAGMATLVTTEGTLVVLPAATDELAEAGVLPDFPALAFAERMNAKALYRPMAAPGVDAERTANSLAWLKSRYPSVSCVVPAGQVVAGYPDLAPITRAVKELGISVGQAEFIRQIGVTELYAGVNPSILPLHSVMREELISRRYSRPQIIERMIRAVHERSIRIILLRPYELYSLGKLEPFLEDIAKIRDNLGVRSYGTGWPEPMPMFRASAGAALGLALMFTLCLWSYGRRFLALSAEIPAIEMVAVGACALCLGLFVWKMPVISKLLGGFSTALLATEAAIWALDHYEKPVCRLIASLLIVLAGGLTVAAFYGTTNSMLRLVPFSGVKMTLLLPPALILVHDLKRRIHPESMADIIKRPPLWGELALIGLILIGGVILTIRSDNASFVPGWEVRFRDVLERVLWVRPRTKEFLIGYPSLIIYYVAEKRGWLPNYREIFRIGASMAFVSAVNSFCHFHTLLPLTAIRVVNGWILGIAVGFVILALIDYVGKPVRKVAARLFG